MARRPRPELGQLRIYLSRRLRSYYAQEAVPVEYKVDTRKLSERGAHRPRVRKISRRVPGMVIAEDTQGEMRRLWVTFSKACDRPACAYAFVDDDDFLPLGDSEWSAPSVRSGHRAVPCFSAAPMRCG